MSDRTEMLQVFLKSEYDKLERRIKAVEDLHKTEIDQRVVGTKVRYRTLNELEAENQRLKELIGKIKENLEDTKLHSSYYCKTDYGQGVVANQITISKLIEEAGL